MKLSILIKSKIYILYSSLLVIFSQFFYLFSFYIGFILSCISFIIFFGIIYGFRCNDVFCFNIPSILSPCDGYIIDIKSSKNFLSLFIESNIFDQYVKYSPVSGIIKNIIHYIPEHNTFPKGFEIEILSDQNINIKLSFAGFENICLVNEGEKINKCSPIAIVLFYCKTSIEIFNLNSPLLPSKGDKLKAGKSHLLIYHNLITKN